MGQTADLFDLQRILLRSKTRLTDQQQQVGGRREERRRGKGGSV